MRRTRIQSLVVFIACLSLVVVGCVAPVAPADSGDDMMGEDDMPLAGSTLRVGSIGDALPALGTQHERLDPAFVEATGVDLQTDFPPFTDYVAKVTTMCQSGSDLYDVMWLDGPWYGLFVSQGCLEDLSDYIASDSDEVALDDYPLRSLAVLGTYNETFYVIPQFAAVGMLAYRMDLFNDPDEQAVFKAEYGYDLQVPETWGQYLDIGTFFTRPDDGLWGFNHRYGNPTTLMGDLLIGFAFSRGASLFDGDWNPTFNTPEMQDALGFFTSEEFLAAQPPGKEGYFTDDVMLNAMQGKVAMYITENWAISNLMDPSRSPMAENLGWALIPGWEDPETARFIAARWPAPAAGRSMPTARTRTRPGPTFSSCRASPTPRFWPKSSSGATASRTARTPTMLPCIRISRSTWGSWRSWCRGRARRGGLRRSSRLLRMSASSWPVR